MKHTDVKINSTHVFLTSSRDMVEISKPLNEYGITYFTHTRSFDNGNRMYLGTHPRLLEHYIKNKWYLVGNVESKPNKYKSQIVFWSTLPKQEIYDNNARLFGIDHGIFIIDPKCGYSDFYGFATHKDNYAIQNIYVNKTEQLKKFIGYYNEQASCIIKKAELSYINLPFHNDELTFIDQDHDKEFDIILANKKSQYFELSKRQIECAMLIMKGKTVKQIAKDINLSHRTIEDYIQNIKIKLSCQNKSELIIKLAKLF